MLNNETLKAIGIVDGRISTESARIKIISIREAIEKEIGHSNLLKLFPPNGCVFGPSFFRKHNDIQEDDLIFLECGENENKSDLSFTREDHMEYVVIDGSVKKNSIKTMPVKELNINNSFIDIDGLDIVLNDYSGKFFVFTEDKILGELRLLANGSVEPVIKKRVYLWNKSDCETIEYNHHTYLLKAPKPKEAYEVLDCMDHKKLFEWFRTHLQRLDPDYVKLLDNKGKWRAEIPKFFGSIDDDSFKLDKVRLNRVADNFDELELSVSKIELLIERSNIFKNIFKKQIEKHKKSFQHNYEHEIKKYQEKSEKKRSNSMMTLERKKLLLKRKRLV